MYNKISTHLLIFGFASVMLIMVVITITGLTRMAVVNRNLEQTITHNNTKTELVSSMRHLARERSLSLNAITIMEDPFERDDEFMRFTRYGGEFARTRNRLKSLDLSENEKKFLRQQGQLTRVAVPMQEKVVDLVSAGNIQQARYVLLNEAIPAQNKVLQQLHLFLTFLRSQTQSSIAQAVQANRYAYVFITVLAVCGLGVGSGISLFVIRRVTKTEQALHEEKERVEVTLHSIGDGVITTDAEGCITYLNPVAENLTGWQNHDARGLPLPEVFQIVNEQDRKPRRNPVAACLQESRIYYLPSPTVLTSLDGKDYAIEDSAAPIRDHEGMIIGAVLVFHDVSNARRMAEQLSWQANHDSLTGLANRSAFELRLRELLDSARHHQGHHALCFLDLDQFKIVNDTCGHVAGDELLRQLAGQFEKIVGDKGKLVARLGGDEFGILIENCSLEQACQLAETIKQRIVDFRFLWEDKTFEIGASIGVVALSQHSENLSHILSTADTACYLAKDKGRNRIHVYQPGDQELAKRHGEMQWVSKITQAMEENRFVLYAQDIAPLQNSAQGLFCELFIYMIAEDGEIVRPCVYLPAAERYALTPAIDRWVIRNTLKTVSECHDELETVAINLSGHSFCEEEFLAEIIEQFDKYNMPPEKVCFEITETAAIANLTKAARFVSVLNDMGCRFALDDFGSGLSSFAYLKNLKVDYLKIDGAFVVDIEHDPIDHAMVEAINDIGHIMGLRTIAEHVENKAVLESVRAMGVDYAQGYHTAKPLPLKDYIQTQSAERVKNRG